MYTALTVQKVCAMVLIIQFKCYCHKEGVCWMNWIRMQDGPLSVLSKKTMRFLRETRSNRDSHSLWTSWKMAFYIFLLMQRIIQTKLLINTHVNNPMLVTVLILWAAYNSVYKKQHLFLLDCKLHGDFVCFVTEHPQYLEQHLALSLYWINSCRV